MKKFLLVHLAIIIQIICGILMFIATWMIFDIHKFTMEALSDLLNKVLTTNSILSAILLTYLFSRLTWVKQRKLDYFIEAKNFSRKVTNYRRILNVFVGHDRFWENVDSTVRLFDTGKYKNLDFCDFRLSHIGVNYSPRNQELIDELDREPRYAGETSQLYLAMASMVNNREARQNLANFPHELHDDHDYDDIYSLEKISDWIRCDIAGLIGSWIVNNHIAFYRLHPAETEIIRTCCSKINSKYFESKLTPDLIKNISSEMNDFYLFQLYKPLLKLETGTDRINSILTFMICVSLALGVIFPLLLQIGNDQSNVILFLIKTVSSLNIGVLSFFLIKFPFLIREEYEEVG